jgi:hypothetical protein
LRLARTSHNCRDFIRGRSEGAMAQNCYSIEKHHNRWSVSVFGVKVLICDSKKIALAVVRQATQALCLDRRQNNGRDAATEPSARSNDAKTPCDAAS